MREHRFAQRVMVVTGAAQGIGKAVALRAAREGASLALIDRAEWVEDVARELRDAGHNILAIRADLEQWTETEQALATAYHHFGRIDILVNNVGGTIWARPYAEYSAAQIEAEVRRSLFPTLWGCRAVLPFMLKQGHGAIVNVSSVATRGVNRVPYSASKGGVNALTQSLAFEYAESGIRINATAPGGTEAPPRLTPRNNEVPSEEETCWYQQVVDQTCDTSLMHRYGTVDEQAAAILFLASDDASYITGTILPVAGGDLG
ncbi:1,6-dihydroxycyclohexa-2,4-diene-1-carboxylate dehydrogenase [Citrobacter portucalensis]|uniref:1,6-dihydroxycyclohexa-2,4-diene-1-carboxylate dehydrogenase n=1 Tax=Citrobacter portucalensis TaxID=1639133 RepID=UPI001580F60B|nr:1,6-dihydroxycyclohexa-2,4-diene-1-carboxylate dehydrogenase [Citrobacter portucalensis]MCA2134731.1 1,6-dihydroxycyclohexa-2,4-diene-1-carboxylate dehydrogenase [Citrobacter portucalensis]MCA2144902.1 1,6-dihydroxycyclohexa-2,4-diene-1-carboxylate dehydrogenase [Citrobacter portucalensis]MCA2149747.1 1,6-dihydroxycyclohexa-2,4-diene-1-carboxylate dehydrogenase [Citrobacter portucalensis]MDX7640293.1 1,6-dihydroxycyclohexa-2,4-diene-1-carboxylate dehydrogenase [Citrobacter portucalensis]NUH